MDTSRITWRKWLRAFVVATFAMDTTRITWGKWLLAFVVATAAMAFSTRVFGLQDGLQGTLIEIGIFSLVSVAVLYRDLFPKG